jgi:oligopeptide/dipeptide ABC transporter ATP-binding protein
VTSATSQSAPPANPVEAPPALSVRNVRHSYSTKSALSLAKATQTEVLKGISLDIPTGKTLGLVGESGCGKTTLVKSILRLVQPTHGEILLNTGDAVVDVLALGSRDLKRVRRRLQVVFQDPYGSLNPRMTVAQTVSEPLRAHLGMRSEAAGRVSELLELVGLDPAMADRYPHEFSGGQRQRIGIARALAFEPTVLVLDEPVSALDVSVQAQILNLIIDLQRKLNLTFLFVSHDLAVIEHVADLVAVMYLGRIVEFGPVDTVFAEPTHPYTKALLSASPIPNVQLERQRTQIVLRGDATTTNSIGDGCQFAPRCPVGADEQRCRTHDPELIQLGDDRRVACHFPDNKIG